MRTTHRDYAEDAGDFHRLARIVTDDPDHVRGHTTWCLGRLADWKFGQVAVLTTRGHRFLFGEALAWVVGNWGERGTLSVEITERAEGEAAALERRGFHRASALQAYGFDLTRALPDAPPLPEGFAIVDMQSHPDYRARRVLRAEAFEGRADLTGCSREALGPYGSLSALDERTYLIFRQDP